MSQPEIIGHDPYQQPLTSLDQLIALFHASARPQTEEMIGIEYEMFGQTKAGPLPYEGPVSITKFFSELIEHTKNTDDPWQAIREGENLVGLTGKRAVIALEPGGQLEIAARPHHLLDEATAVFHDLVVELNDVAQALGIKLFAVGIHPNARQEDMAVVKKARYGIMRAQMQGLHGLGLDMMTRSCAIQINLDYENETDFVAKGRLGAALIPFYSLLCTSSAFINGAPATFAIERGNVWRKTDPARTGIPALIFAPNFGYEAWIEMVLDVPMYFIRRDGTYIDARNASFRDFMHSGLLGQRATVRDFIDHMSTVFTDVRYKPILELRSPDSLPVPYVNAIAALSYALFYEAQSEAHALLGDLTHAEIVTLQNDTIDKGRAARLRGKLVFDWAAELLAVADRALAKNQQSALLAPLHNLVTKNITCAEWILAHYQPLNDKHFAELIDSFAPLNNPLQ